MLKKMCLVVFLALAAVGVMARSLVAGTMTPAGQPAASAQIVTVGFYPVSVYELEMGNGTYFVDMYVWMRWKGQTDPTASIEFTNMVDEWGKQQEVLHEKPKQLPDGSLYQIMRVEGRFVQAFDMVSYPLDRQKLSIFVEDSVNTADAVHYQIDRDNSGIGSNLKIPGWSLSGWSANSYVHDYASNLGEDAAPSLYSAAEFALNIERPLSFFYWKLLLPLGIVLLAALSALLLAPRSIDARTALPGGALLTAIFLQKSYSDGLPDIGYLILMDQIYWVAYALIVATLIRTIFTFQKAEAAAPEVVIKMAKADRSIMWLLLAAFPIATFVLISLHG